MDICQSLSEVQHKMHESEEVGKSASVVGASDTTECQGTLASDGDHWTFLVKKDGHLFRWEGKRRDGESDISFLSWKRTLLKPKETEKLSEKQQDCFLARVHLWLNVMSLTSL